MKIDKDTAIEIRQINGSLKLFLLTGLVNEFDVVGENGILIINPLDAMHLTENREYPNKERFFWVDRNDFLVQWENAKGERGRTFADVALFNKNSDDYDAWLVAEYIKAKDSEITKSKIGSTHWFNTIISEHCRIGEYMKGLDDPLKQGYANTWGESLYKSSKELLHWAERSKNKQLTNE